MKQITSVRELAKIAQVSPATISKVINGRSGVHQDTVARVRSLMDEHDFHPKSKAVDAARILVVVPGHSNALTDSYVSAILAGVAEASFSAGLSISLKKMDKSWNSAADLRHLLRQEGASGIILPALSDGYLFADKLGIEKLAHVVVGATRHEHDVYQVVLDDVGSARRAVRHLKSLGHEKISIITCDRHDLAQSNRYGGFLAETQDLGLSADLKKGIEVQHACPASGEYALSKLMQLRTPPSAVLVTNEHVAIGLSRAATSMGLSVPGDLSIVSYESKDMLDFVDPALTAMASPAFEMGLQAVQMLEGQLNQDENEPYAALSMLLQHSLVVRKSTGIPTPQ